MRRVRDADLAAFDHQDVPFDAVVRGAQPGPRRGRRNPLFQVMVVHRQAAGLDGEWTLPGLRVAFADSATGVARFDLVFAFAEEPGGGIDVLLEYRTELFDAASVTRLGDRLRGLLAAAVADPDAPLSRVDLLDDAERTLVLATLNDTARDVPELTFPALFAARVAADPDAVAVVDGGREVSYAALDAMAARVAALLARRGVGAEDVVGVAVPRSLETVATVLGVLRLGAAYLPLDLVHPPDRLAYMIDDSGARLVVTTAAEAAAVPPVDGVELLVLPGLGGEEAGSPPLPPIGLHQAAYVIYTSGSTGRPKGVVVAHEGIASLVATAQDRMGVDGGQPGAAVRLDRLRRRGVRDGDGAVHRRPARGGARRPAGRRPRAHRTSSPRSGITHMILPPSLVSALPAGCDPARRAPWCWSAPRRSRPSWCAGTPGTCGCSARTG